MRPPPIPTEVAPAARPSRLAPGQVTLEFRRRVEDGLEILPAGTAARAPRRLLSGPYAPRHRFDLFDTRFYLADVRQNDYVRFFVAYVVQGERAFPRLFYKDVSLIWRCASHLTRLGGDWWISKGEIITREEGGEEVSESKETTTDLPLEIQDALEAVLRRAERIPADLGALQKFLRRAPNGRLEPYRDFLAPRERAQADPRNRIHAGRRVARFTRPGDPTSLVFARGFEPDFRRGVLESSSARSRLYAGRLRRFRILSKNRRIQYLFMSGPRHTWIIPPQATTTELSTYGVRTVDVEADEDLFVPGYEYHFMDGGELHTQIPEGYAGEPSAVDPARADASAWLDRLPVVRAFRRRVLGT